MRKGILFALILTVPLLLSTQVWQVYRYNKLEEEVIALEEEQRQWLEKNKKILANIALFSTPERVERLALEDLHLENLDYRKVWTVRLPSAEEF